MTTKSALGSSCTHVHTIPQYEAPQVHGRVARRNEVKDLMPIRPQEILGDLKELEFEKLNYK